MAIYVTSDLHGNIRAWDSIMNQIGFSENDHLFVLGDVVDRNPGGIYLMQKLMSMDNATVLLGNHEYMMLRALGIKYKGVDITYGEEEDQLKYHWYENGGNITSYEWNYCLTKSQRVELGDWISNLEPQRIIVDSNDSSKKFLLCHAAPAETYDPERSYHFNQLEHVVWDREELKNPTDLGMPVIFGHTPTTRSEFKSIRKGQENMIAKLRNNWYAIDCGAGWGAEMGGRLSCLRLNDMAEFYSDGAVRTTASNTNKGGVK